MQALSNITDSHWGRFRSYTRNIHSLRLGTPVRLPSGLVGFANGGWAGSEDVDMIKLSDRQLERLLCGGMSSMKLAFPLLRSFTYDYNRHERCPAFEVQIPDYISEWLLLELGRLPSLLHLNLKFHPDGHPQEDILPSTLPLSLSSLDLMGGPEQLMDLLKILEHAHIHKLCLSHYDSMWRRKPEDDYLTLFKALNKAGRRVQEVIVDVSLNEFYSWDFEEDREDQRWRCLFQCLRDLGGPNLTTFKCCPPIYITFPPAPSWNSLAKQWYNLKILHIGHHEYFPYDSSVAVTLPAAVDLALLLPCLAELRIPFTISYPFHPQASSTALLLRTFGYACGRLDEEEVAAVVHYLQVVFPHLKSLILGSKEEDDGDEDQVNGWQAVREVSV
ncbi:hypothetical protein DXG01_002788 [Tephrocybe rancida]|nr:hypothetical protein DXG01_002788 [Tephrocybe rancida]